MAPYVRKRCKGPVKRTSFGRLIAASELTGSAFLGYGLMGAHDRGSGRKAWLF